ncbi:uncharacterized protein C8R40DRAFT_372382 [Lentinula edodes]|uniref:uncharacterized protein n=1 Tax=Lentinula edodes TaxID=5353 RepID=UPI001E8E3C09|nr:uncharacterized protein C8R40DRAFT_372382 [Lentinula edodes]KAH7873592.1 hypothetical protein C8R40DRAFT_372382 [Lentinula edodes]
MMGPMTALDVPQQTCLAVIAPQKNINKSTFPDVGQAVKVLLKEPACQSSPSSRPSFTHRDTVLALFWLAMRTKFRLLMSSVRRPNLFRNSTRCVSSPSPSTRLSVSLSVKYLLYGSCMFCPANVSDSNQLAWPSIAVMEVEPTSQTGRVTIVRAQFPPAICITPQSLHLLDSFHPTSESSFWCDRLGFLNGSVDSSQITQASPSRRPSRASITYIHDNDSCRITSIILSTRRIRHA